MKRINSRIETVQLFLRSFDTGKLSIETKLPIHCTRDSWKSTLEFLFQFVRSRRTLHGTSASYSRFSRFEPRVIRFLFFRTPFVSSSRFLLKRNEGGYPPPPPFSRRIPSARRTRNFTRFVSSTRSHGTRTAKPFDYRPATYRRLSVWNTGHPRISPSPPIMLISR